MSSASDRPIPLEPTDSDSLVSADDETSRTLTGVRRRASSSSELDASAKVEVELPLESAGPSPESLRRPFSVLTSPPRMDSLPPPSGVHPSASRAPSGANPSTGYSPSTPPGSRTPSESKRWTENTEARRKVGVCAKHGIARSPSGACLLCEKEAPRKSNSLVYLAIGILLVGGAAAIVFLR